MAKAPTYKAPKAYSSQYAGQIASLIGDVTNRQEFSYNPLEDANYQALANVYNANGQKAMRDTLGQAAALNGGYNTSWATSAAAQAKNDYNQQLAAMIPELEQNAYSRYYDSFNMDLSALGALQSADQDAYSKYRDTVGDTQWQYGQKYQKYRDSVADSQWQKEYNLSKKRAARSGGGRRGGSGGGSYAGSAGGSISGLDKLWNAAGSSGGTKNDPSGTIAKSKNSTGTKKSYVSAKKSKQRFANL